MKEGKGACCGWVVGRVIKLPELLSANDNVDTPDWLADDLIHAWIDGVVEPVVVG